MKFSKSSIFIALATVTRFTLGAMNAQDYNHDKAHVHGFAVSNAMHSTSGYKRSGKLMQILPTKNQWKEPIEGIVEFDKFGRIIFNESHRTSKVDYERLFMQLDSIDNLTTKKVNGDYEFILSEEIIRPNGTTDTTKFIFRIAGDLNSNAFQDALYQLSPKLADSSTKNPAPAAKVRSLREMDRYLLRSKVFSVESVVVNRQTGSLVEKILEYGKGKPEDQGSITIILDDGAPKIILSLKEAGDAKLVIDLESNGLFHTEVSKLAGIGFKFTVREWTEKPIARKMKVSFFIPEGKDANIMETVFQGLTGTLVKDNTNASPEFQVFDEMIEDAKMSPTFGSFVADFEARRQKLAKNNCIPEPAEVIILPTKTNQKAEEAQSKPKGLLSRLFGGKSKNSEK